MDMQQTSTSDGHDTRVLRLTANDLEHRVVLWSPENATDTAEPARVARNGTAQPMVVLIHGFMDAAATWERVGVALARAGYRVAAPDMRGFGEGARVPKGGYYHFADYVFDVADIVEALSPNEPVLLVGHSMGGTVATLFAGTFPERVTRLANLEGLGPPDNDFDVAPVRMRSWIDQVRRSRRQRGGKVTFSREDALVRLAANHPNVPRSTLEELLPALTTDEGDGRVSWHFDALHRTTSPQPFYAKQLMAFARRITAPTLFVSGGPSGFHPPDEDERLASFASHRRIELADAGHMMHWTRPDALAAELVGFFREP